MGQKNTLTDQLSEQGKDVTQEITRLIQKHGAVTPIANELGVTNSTVSYHLKKAGYAFRWSQVPDTEIVTKYVELGSEDKVAEHFNISSSFVHGVLIRQLDVQLSGETYE